MAWGSTACIPWLTGLLSAALAALSFLACSSPNNPALSDATDSEADGTGSSSGSSSSGSGSNSSSGSSSGSGGHLSGSSGSSGADASSSANERVDSGIPFTDAGVPYCNPTTPCDLSKNTCCVDTFGNGTCDTGHSVSCGVGGSFQCIKESECPTGQLCCGYQTDSMHGGSKCEAVSMCPSQTSAQLCETSAECPNALECIPQSCNVGAPLPANLMLCGLQSNATYTCTAR
jgi:hypothetical protein